MILHLHIQTQVHPTLNFLLSLLFRAICKLFLRNMLKHEKHWLTFASSMWSKKNCMKIVLHVLCKMFHNFALFFGRENFVFIRNQMRKKERKIDR